MILYGLLFAVWTAFMVLHPHIKRTLQNDPYDVAVLLDSADDFRSEDFRAEIAFALDLLEIFWGNNTRMGFYTFGGTTKQHFALDTHTKLFDLVSAIRTMQYSKGKGESLEDAMMHVVENAFSVAAGGRLCAPNVLVVLTHTSFSGTTDVDSLKRAIRGYGINLVVIDLTEGGGDHGFSQLKDNRTVIYRGHDISNLQDTTPLLMNYTETHNLTNDCATLTDWQPWSSCNSTCDMGFRLRFRSCSKNEELEEIDCMGELSEYEACNLEPCVDCNRPCPPGGQLSDDCEVCECYYVTLLGDVTDSQGSEIGNASIYLKSRPNETLVETNDIGTFQISEVCIMNEQVTVDKEGYTSEIVIPTEINTTHWRIEAEMLKHVAPLFNITPSSKVRLVGRNASLYCSAEGNPMPRAYKWYKNNIELEGSGTGGVLTLVNLSKDDAGQYKCSSETEAGVSQTPEALLVVKEAASLDVAFLIDTSDEFRSENFSKERQFVLDLLEIFWGNKIRVGLYSFGEATKQHFTLDEYTDLSDLKFAIINMPFRKGNGEALEDALAYVVESAFSARAGGRLCIPNVLVALTHDGFDGAADVTSLHDQVRGYGVNLVVIDLAEDGEDHDFGVFDDNRTVIYRTNEMPNLGELASVLMNFAEGNNLTNDCATLTDWQPWSGCTSTCGPGFRLRFRTCSKDEELDEIDCLGELSEDQPCKMEPCKDPVDGEWSDWVSWSECSQTCDKGTQERIRVCDEPPPAFGGKECPGSKNQTRYCADWKCPDCSKPCPPGGQLSADCEVCECSSVTLMGKVKDTLNSVVGNASVFLESRPYKTIGETNEFGMFRISGVCIMNDQVIIGKAGYSSELETPTQVNASHWRIDAIISKQVAPLFNTIPNYKVRMVGQSVSLCCSAVGTPTPSEYKWYKNNIEMEGQGTDGVLTLANLSKEDAGRYKCSSETEAGVSQTPEALLVVKEQDEDTCGEPVSRYETLPPTCYVSEDSSMNNTLDVRTCEKSKCITDEHVDNGTCSDWWPRHCCDVGETEEVNIICDGFTYKASRVKTCICQMCISKTTVSGRAYGKAKGKKIPFQLGLITANGQEIARTAMSGHFRFDVPADLKRAILRFTDIVFDKFLDHVKIVNINEESDTQVPVVIPMKPKPAPFNPDLGIEIPLESSHKTGVPPASRISIPENSTVTRDGEPYHGPANVTVHFMDPRSRDDLEMANGEFVYENPNGDMLPLQTYGVFQLAIRDEYGNPLQTTKPIQTTFDNSLFNVSLDRDGNPDLELWHYDGNKGLWVTQGKMEAPAVSSDGRRRLLANGQQLVKPFIPPNIPEMTAYDSVTKFRKEVEWVWNVNYDRRVKREVVKSYTEEVLRDEVCYVCVSAYKDYSLREPSDAGTVSITAYSQDQKDGTYLGIKTETVNEYGQACLMVFCNKHVYLTAVGDGVQLLPETRLLPEIYPLRNRNETRKKREVKFESRDFGRALMCNKGQVCKGPIYPFKGGKGENECKDRHSDNSFRFAFAPFTKKPSLSFACGSRNEYNKKLSWHPVSPDEKKLRTCFIKVQIRVTEAYDLRVISKSHLEEAERETFGTHDVGPIPDHDTGDLTNRAACVEFRCPGLIKDGGKESFNRSTFVSGRLMSNETLRCTLSFNQNLTTITNERDEKGFKFEAEAGRNYGPAFGVFINDAEAEQVQDYCYSGWDSGPSVGGVMKPDINPAMTFDCLKPVTTTVINNIF